MATRAVQMTIQYLAWSTTANAGRTNDQANHTLRWIKDGTAAAPTNIPVQIDATNAPGLYKLTLTTTETDADIGTLHGRSSTASVVIVPITIQFERLPNAAAGAIGGLPTVDASNAVKLQTGTGSNQILLSVGQVTIGTNNDKNNYNLSGNESFIITSGVAQSGTSSTIVLAFSASPTDSFYNGAIVKIYGGTGVGQARIGTGYVGFTRTITVDRPWVVNPDSTSLYSVMYETTIEPTLLTNLASVKTDTNSVAQSIVTAKFKKNLAVRFPIVMYDAAGNPATGKTVTLSISKDGGVEAAGGATITEISNGSYDVQATSSDLNANSLIFRFSAIGCKNTYLPIVTIA